MSHAIGIIGGADGPTAVFVTGNPASGRMLFVLLAAAALLALWFLRKK